MFNFELDPPSAYTNSYIDIKFIITLDSIVPEATVEITNQTTGEKLMIVAVLSGSITGDTQAVIRNSNRIEGFINIFNKDKMAINFANYASVDISASVTVDGKTETKEITFYNQSKSIDAAILPFDIKLLSNTIDLANHKPMQMAITSNTIAKYEMCVRSSDYTEICTFEIITKPGVSIIDVPSAVLWNDLKLEIEMKPPYQLYLVKLEGINFNKTMNRSYLPIPNTQISFETNEMFPIKQDRVDPLGNVMGNEFVLSDRYFVHTLNKFTPLASATNWRGSRSRYLTMYLHESQNMHLIDQSVALFSKDQNKRSEARQAIRRNQIVSKSKPEVQVNEEKFFHTFSVPVEKPKQVLQPSVKQSAPKTGGCGCARKK